MRRSQAFTLIELLVVIAIVGILSAILFPVFASAREKARQTACLSNENQLGLAFMQYEQDYDERGPGGGNWYGAGTGWACQLYPYVKSTAVYICSDDTWEYPVVSYGFNDNCTTTTGTAPSPPIGRPLSQFVSPARTVLLFEVTHCAGTHAGGGFSVSYTPYVQVGADIPTGNAAAPYEGYSPTGHGLGETDTELDGYNDSATPRLQYATGYMQYSTQGDISSGGVETSLFAAPTGRHNGGSNFILADGHAKWLPGQDVSAGNTNSNVGKGNCGSTTPQQAAATDCATPSIAATFSLN